MRTNAGPHCEHCAGAIDLDAIACPTCGKAALGLPGPGTPRKRITRCRYLCKRGDQCTAEVADELGEILLCPMHLARALELMKVGQ